MIKKVQFKRFKQQLMKEEKAFKKLREYYPYLVNMSDTEVMNYLNFKDRKELVSYVSQLQPAQQNNHHSLEEKCLCMDGNGVPKILYHSEKEAEKVLHFVCKERRLLLKIYPCPSTCGWHLSKA